MKKRIRRSRVLLEPRLQLTFALLFVAIVMVAIVAQTFAVSYTLTRAAAELPNDAAVLMKQQVSILLTGCGITILVLTPLTFVVGVLTTHKIVGPLYRFRVFLTQVCNGEQPPDCRIRSRDSLQELCELMNRATEQARGVNAERESLADDPERDAA